MVRKDREVTDLNDIVEIMGRCYVCRLALNGDDGFPYILPLNFGFVRSGDSIVLYFHSASVGKKHVLIAANPRASFEMDCNHRLLSLEDRGYCTMNYESVIGRGRIEYIEDEDEKIAALTVMTDRYHESHFEFNKAAISRTSVYRLIVEGLTAKRKNTQPK